MARRDRGRSPVTRSSGRSLCRIASAPEPTPGMRRTRPPTHTFSARTAELSQKASVLGDDVPLRTVTLVEAPTSAGGYVPGQEDGPRAVLEAGLGERLQAPEPRFPLFRPATVWPCTLTSTSSTFSTRRW